MEEIIKGQKVDITKNRPNVSDIVIGVGWKLGKNYPADLTFDLALILGDEKGNFDDPKDFVYYGNPIIMGRREETVLHKAVDEVYTEGLRFDDLEQIKVSLYELPEYIRCLTVVGSIYEPTKLGHKLGEIEGLHLHIFNEHTNEELFYSLMNNYFQLETCITFGRFYRMESEWKFEMLQEGFMGDLGTLFGVYYNGKKLKEGDAKDE